MPLKISLVERFQYIQAILICRYVDDLLNVWCYIWKEAIELLTGSKVKYKTFYIDKVLI